MIASGVLLTWYLTARLAGKRVAVLAARALALSNRLGHTPALALARGEAGAGARLASSIRLEVVLVLLAFSIAVGMVSVHPIDYGHRIQN